MTEIIKNSITPLIPNANVRHKNNPGRIGVLTGNKRERGSRIYYQVKYSDGTNDYVFVNELIHLLERHHNERFIKLMDKYMPQWRIHRDELNCSPLKDEVWRT